MAKFQLQAPDGKTYIVEGADDPAAAVAALKKQLGTLPPIPPGFQLASPTPAAMTIDQQRAIAMANARMRAAKAGGAGPWEKYTPPPRPAIQPWHKYTGNWGIDIPAPPPDVASPPPDTGTIGTGKSDFAPMAVGVKKPGPNVPPQYNGLESGLAGAVDTATLGLGDEAAAGITSLITGEKYDDVLARGRGRIAEAQAVHPNYFLGGQVLGAVPAAVAIPGGVAARGTGLGRTMYNGVKAGAAIGAGYGFNSGEGGFTNRVKNAVPSAVTGAAAGGLIPPVARLAGKVLAPGINAFAGAGAPRMSGATRRVFDAFQRDAVDPATVAGMGDRSMPMDFGTNLNRQAARIYATPGEGQRIIAAATKARSDSAPSHIRSSLDGTLGPAPIPAAIENNIAAGQKALGPEYEAALKSAKAVDTTPIANELDAQAVNLRGSAQDAVQKVRSMLNVTGTSTLDPNPATLLQTRQAIDGMLTGETDGNVKRVLSAARQKIDDELTANVPGIKTVDAKYAELARQREAFDRGQGVLDSGRSTAIRPAELASEVGQGGVPQGTMVGPSAVPHRMAQGVRADLDRIVGTNSNDVAALHRLINGEGDWNRDKLRTVFGADRADRMLTVLDNARNQAASTARATGNSETAARILADDDVQGGAHKVLEHGANAFIYGGWTGPLRAAGVGVLRKTANAFSGGYLGRRQAAMARMLTAQGPDQDELINALVNTRNAKAISAARRSVIANSIENVGSVAARQGAIAAVGHRRRFNGMTAAPPF